MFAKLMNIPGQASKIPINFTQRLHRDILGDSDVGFGVVEFGLVV